MSVENLLGWAAFSRAVAKESRRRETCTQSERISSRRILTRYSLFVTLFAVSVVSGTMIFLHRSEVPDREAVLSEQGSGTIYCRLWQDVDGKTRQLTAGSTGLGALPMNVRGEPCRLVQGTRRWFADARQSAGPSDASLGRRYRLVVVREDGLTVQLSDGHDIEPQPGSVRWPIHARDEMLSWIGRRWNGDGVVVEGGIYTARLVRDEQGNISAVENVSESPVVDLPLAVIRESGEWFRSPVPDAESLDWSPDGKRIALASREGGLYAVDVDGGQPMLMTRSPAADPLWSPDGRMIAFKIRTPLGGVAIIPATGGTPEVIFGPLQGTPFAVTSPCWSPSARYIVFGYMGPGVARPEQPVEMDLMAVDLVEHRYVNLTRDMEGAYMPTAWR